MPARVMPNDLDAERSVLGSMLMSKNACSEALGKLHPEDFYQEPHRLIFSAMSALYAQNQPVDVTTVTAYLRNLNQLEKTGGVEYLFQLSESVPTIKHTPFYCKIIEDKAVLRRLIRQSERIVEGAYGELENIDDFISQSEQDMLKVTRDRTTASSKMCIQSSARSPIS